MLVADSCGTNFVLSGVEGPDTTMASTINNSISAMLVAVGTEGSVPFLVPSASKFVPKPIVTLASPVAGPSAAPIVSRSAPKPAAAAALSKPTPAKSAGPAVKGGFASKDPFTVRRFKLAGMEESGALIINQVTKVLVIQGTLRSEESSDEDAQGDDDNSDGGDVVMNVDSAKQPEGTRPVALIKAMVTEVKASALGLAPALMSLLFFVQLLCC
ncbi:hypothetical protein C0995_004059 [Termitomyces sp. Mi166|nr:hypothetical protein C0995_004059 [Termitomyces sp. Mi166\